MSKSFVQEQKRFREQVFFQPDNFLQKEQTPSIFTIRIIQALSCNDSSMSFEYPEALSEIGALLGAAYFLLGNF